MADSINPGHDLVVAAACALIAAFALVLAGPARAEIGPCKPDQEMLLCGSGKGAARVRAGPGHAAHFARHGCELLKIFAT